MSWKPADGRLRVALLLACCLALGAAVRIDGQVLHAERIAIRGLAITDVVCIPQLRGDRLHLGQLEATCYRGRLLGEASYLLSTGDLQLTLELRRLYLQDLVAALGGEPGMGGLLDLDCSLGIPRGNWQAARGRIEIRLRHGSLLSLPGLADLLLESESHRGLDRGEAVFLVADGRVLIDHLRIDNPAVRVKGRGSIGLDGTLEVTLNPMAKAGLLRQTPLIGWLIANTVRELTRGALKVRVGGHITAPTFRTTF